MKKYFLFVITILLCVTSYAQQEKTILKKPKIDERVELVSIIARLAEFPEYNQENYPVYVKDIHNWFDKYKDHPAVKLLKELRKNKGLSFDQPMTMAVHLSQPPGLEPLVPFSETIPNKRWGKEGADEFVAAINDFNKTSNAKAFFDAHQALYGDIIKRYEGVYGQLDIDWYKTFYGELPYGTFNIVLGLSNRGNYGPKVVFPDKTEERFAIEGVGDVDSLGMPVFDAQIYLPILIHEFNHSFVNRLGDLYESSLEKSSQLIFTNVEDEMKRQAYGEWKAMFNEALVRAAVIRYLIKHPLAGNATEEKINQEARGFYWMSDLVDLLGTYEQNRNKYKRLADFMPEVISFYDAVAPKLDAYKDAYKNHCPSIVSTSPLLNDTLVNPGVKELVFNFNNPLIAGRYGFGPTKKGLTHYPANKGVKFINDNKTVIMSVELKPDTYYEIHVVGRFFKNTDGYRSQDYQLNFKTAP